MFSKTLDRADWAESRIARDELAEAIAVLKQEGGADIIAHGGAMFAQGLSRLGLVEEFPAGRPPGRDG